MPKKLLQTRAAQAKENSAGHRFFLLFVFLIAYLILYPYTQNSTAGYVTFRLFAIAITLLSVYAVSFRRSLVLIALALAIPSLIEHLRVFQNDVTLFYIVNISLTPVFDAFIITVIFRRVFLRARTNREAVFGALCIYLLIGFGFANLYRLVATLQRHAFYLNPTTNLHTVPNQFDFIFYSFGTMTSMGAAGITAVADSARSLSVIEAIVGLLYLAVLISRLMSVYRSDR